MKVQVYSDNGNLLFEDINGFAGDCDSYNCSVGEVTRSLMTALKHRDLVHRRRFCFGLLSRWETAEEFHIRREWDRHREDPKNYPAPGTEAWKSMWRDMAAKHGAS